MTPELFLLWQMSRTRGSFGRRKPPLLWLLLRLRTLSTSDIRTLNRYYLHPHDRRCCSKCFTIFKGMRANFHVKKREKSGQPALSVWCKTCKNSYSAEIRGEYRKTPETFISSRVAGYKHRAKQDGVDFNLTAASLIEIFNRQEGKCYYTGQQLDFTLVAPKRNYPHRRTPSLDRLSPRSGYVEGNVVWCCYYVNRMKNDLTESEFISACKTILRRRG